VFPSARYRVDARRDEALEIVLFTFKMYTYMYARARVCVCVRVCVHVRIYVSFIRTFRLSAHYILSKRKVNSINKFNYAIISSPMKWHNYIYYYFAY